MEARGSRGRAGAGARPLRALARREDGTGPEVCIPVPFHHPLFLSPPAFPPPALQHLPVGAGMLERGLATGSGGGVGEGVFKVPAVITSPEAGSRG